MAEETTALLSADQNGSGGGVYGGNGPSNIMYGDGSFVGSDEVPPPYDHSDAGVPMVTCRVCQTMIDISGKMEQHVVKCNECNEATPIKNAPPGKKYVRCPCNCLLICKSRSQRIACPRSTCKRIINLTPPSASAMGASMAGSPGMCRVTCAHCNLEFIFNTLTNALARCPNCRKVSSVGPDFAQWRGRVFAIVFAVVTCAFFAVLISTVRIAPNHPYIYVAYIVLGLLMLLFLYRTYYYCSMKVSHIDGPV